jgi:two-component system chemotaxis response regulator CheY
MEKIYIIYVDDQREVLSTLEKDLEQFESHFSIEGCENSQEAIELIDGIDAEGNFLGLIISDHIMPGKNGVEFLTEINNDGRFARTKKILLTGMATHKDTITAINNANINHYVEKPWDSSEIKQIIKELLTQFIMEMGIEYNDFKAVIDNNTLMSYLRKTT